MADYEQDVRDTANPPVTEAELSFSINDLPKAG